MSIKRPMKLATQLIHMIQAEDLPRPLTQPDMAEVDVPRRFFVCFFLLVKLVKSDSDLQLNGCFWFP